MLIKKLFLKFFSKSTQLHRVGSSNEKNRIKWLEQKLKEIADGSKILDAGAGEQPFKEYCNHLNYYSQDFGQYKPEGSNSGLQVKGWSYGNIDLISDIADIPAEDEFFDAIMCTEVLEHTINPREAIQEFSRLLKSGGSLIITTPFCSLTHFAPYHFYTGFNRYFFETELSMSGFKIKEIIPNGNYFEYLAQEINRLPFIAKKYTGKKINYSDSRNLLEIKTLLQKLTETDSGSLELLCYGYFVVAEKI